MKKLAIALIFISITVFSVMVNAQNYKQIPGGAKASINSIDVEVQFLSPKIVRVTKSLAGTKVEKKSLSVIKQPEKVELKYANANDNVMLISNDLSVILNTTSGKIIFRSADGTVLFAEKEYGIQFTPTKDVKESSFRVRQAFVLDSNEAIYGLGQQQNGNLIQRRQRVVLQNQNMKICIPYFLSLKGYAIFWDNYAPTTFTDNQQETSFESLGKCADYYFMLGGTGNGTIAQMRELTGQAPLWPLWSFGYWQSRERYKTQQELLEVVDKYRTLKVPLDGIIQDWRYWGQDSVWNAMSFDPTTYPDPKGMADKVHQQNAHLMIVAWPGFGPLTQQYRELKSKKMLIDFETWPPKSGTKPYDVYNPTSRDIYWDYLNKGVFSVGTDAWWLDSSEPDHINIKDIDFDQPTYLGSFRSVINAFPLMHTTGIYEHQRATTSNKRVCILTRSAFAGQQRNAANSWSGDVSSSWESLQRQIPAALNFSLCGIPYWNADIGGFFAGSYKKNGGAQNPEFQELYIRWAQFACFTPMMRSHGTDIPREIYQFGERGNWPFDAIERVINLRYAMLPYLYSTAWDVTSKAGSFMIALPLVYPTDVRVRNLTNEYMFGRSLLVAPVVNPLYVTRNEGRTVQDFGNVKSRKVYLPKGSDWIDFWTGEKISGGQDIAKQTPLDIIPFYVKAGSVLPIGPKVQYATERKWDNLEIRIYPGANGTFTLYEDESDNYNYEKGAYSNIEFNWNEKTHTLSIGERKGNFSGMLSKRKFNIVLVSTQKGYGDKRTENPDKVIVYSGKAIDIRL